MANEPAAVTPATAPPAPAPTPASAATPAPAPSPDATATPPATPADVALSFPEGLTAADLGDFAPFVKDQKALDSLLKLDASRNAKAVAAYEARQKSWKDAVSADKDIGGAHLEASLATAKKALVKFGGEPLIAALNETGLGDHPALVKFFVSVGKAMAEDSVAGTSGPGVGAVDPELAKQRAMFPTMFSKE